MISTNTHPSTKISNANKFIRQQRPKPQSSQAIIDAPTHDRKSAYSLWEVESHTVVVIPSLSFCEKELKTVDYILCYEERILFVLLALAHPQTNLLIVTSMNIDECIVQYYLSFLPSGCRESARRRVRFYSLDDPSDDTFLAKKLCHRADILDNIQDFCSEFKCNRSDANNLYMMVCRATDYEARLSKTLGLPYFCARPEQAVYGTKQGSRSIFRHLEIPCADGTYEVEKDIRAVCESIWDVLRRNPGARKGIVKLADGFSGMGNAIVGLTKVQKRLRTLPTLCQCCQDDRLYQITLESLYNATFHHHTWTTYQEEIMEMGCIFELFLERGSNESGSGNSRHSTTTSPSVQGIIDERGEVFILSSHEQTLDDQVYLGCEFPCKAEYRPVLMKYAFRIGTYLASMGVHDRFGVDFVCIPSSNGIGWKVFAIEINLRITGTTHPWMVLKLLTHGKLNKESGIFETPRGEAKFYISSDNARIETLKINAISPEHLCKMLKARPDLNWDRSKEKGVVIHMLSIASKAGKLSMTAIANSIEEARILFDETKRYIEQETS